MQLIKSIEAVIDAGSSGTRIYLYEVTPDEYPLIELLLHKEFSVTPKGNKEDGINNYIDPNKPWLINEVCEEAIKPLLDYVNSYLIKHQKNKADVVVNLFATAGMRYAEQHFGKAKTDHLYELIRDHIKSQGFLPGEIRTSDGNKEEGIWTWINLNDVYRDIFRTSAHPFGIIEVGGSSTQLSFPVSHNNQYPGLIQHISINNRSFDIFSKTYLGLGQDDARKRMREVLGPNSSSACFPKGFASEMDMGDVRDGFAELRLGSDGDYEFNTCHNCYDIIIEEIRHKNPFPNLIDTNVEFVGIDGVYHVLKFWNIEKNASSLKFHLNANTCDINNFENIADNEFVQVQAANATYIHSLLFGRNGLIAENPKKLIDALPNKSNEGRLLTWTRGYLLLKYGNIGPTK